MTRRQFLESWMSRIKSIPISALEERQKLLREAVALFPDPSEEERQCIVELAEEVEDSFDYIRRDVEGENQIAFFRPSLEQALVINAWAPWALDAFENVSVDRVPDFGDYEGGYRSIGNFSCNRGAGKTCSSIIDTILWLIPNDPDWRMFDWMEDRASDGRLLSNARYRILPRPDWEMWFKRGRVRYNGTDAPPKGACDIWHGCGRADDWHSKLWLEYKRWLPKKYMGVRDDGFPAVFKLELRFQTIFGHNVMGKSMSAEEDSWAGKQCWRLNVDEGIDKGHFREGMTRIGPGGYYHQAYTPVDPSNIGEKSMVAQRIFKGEKGFELVGKAKFFHRFRIADSSFLHPDQIEHNLRRWKGMGAEGESRANGGFFNSSPTVFTNFKREVHVLPWTTDQIVKAINGNPDPGLEALQGANIIRGFDEGLADPAACVWTALLRTGELVFFREWEKSGLSIGDQMDTLIKLSGNRKEEVRYAFEQKPEEEEVEAYAKAAYMDKKREEKGQRLTRYREVYQREFIRKTLCDPAIFRRDPNFVMDNWSENYARAGIRMEKSGSEDPARRCGLLNEYFMPDPTRKHLLEPDQTGTRAYVSVDCPKLIERFENMLNEQRKDGTFTGKPEHDDSHVPYAACYVVIGRVKWVANAVLKSYRKSGQEEQAAA